MHRPARSSARRCYATKSIRNGLRAGDLLRFDTFEQKLRVRRGLLPSREPLSWHLEAHALKQDNY